MKSDALNKLDKINKSLYNPKVEIYVSENQSPEGVPISHQSPSSSGRSKRNVSKVKTDMTSQQNIKACHFFLKLLKQLILVC